MEHNISFKDLLVGIARRWRTIIIVMFAFATIIGCLKFILSYKTMIDVETVAQSQKAYNDNMSSYNQQKNDLEILLNSTSKTLENLQEYSDNSILMKIDPYKEAISTVLLYVDTDYQIMPGMLYQNPNKVGQLSYLYRTFGNDEVLLNDIIEVLNLDTDLAYLNEVVNIADNASAQTVEITVKYKDVITSEKIAAYISDYLINKIDDVSEYVGHHTLRVINKSSYETVDLALEKSQKDKQNEIKNIRTSIEDIEKQIAELSEPTNLTMTLNSVIQSSIIYAILGAFIGLVTVGLMLSMIVAAHDKVTSEKDLFYTYGINILGFLEIPSEQGRKRNV